MTFAPVSHAGVFTRRAVRGRRRPLLASHGALQHLHVGRELVQEALRPRISGFGGLAVVHPVLAAVAWDVEQEY